MLEQLIAAALPEILNFAMALLEDISPRSAPWVKELADAILFDGRMDSIPRDERGLLIQLLTEGTSLPGLIASRMTRPAVARLIDRLRQEIIPPGTNEKPLWDAHPRFDNEAFWHWMCRLSILSQHSGQPKAATVIMNEYLNA